MTGNNYLIGDFLESDKDLFFGPLEGETFIALSKEATWVDIVIDLGLFPSRGQAKKNNWHKPIEPGFSIHLIGKDKKQVFILKII